MKFLIGTLIIIPLYCSQEGVQIKGEIIQLILYLLRHPFFFLFNVFLISSLLT